MLYYISMTLLCFFAAMGIVYFIRTLFDSYISGKLGVRCTLTLESAESTADIEYALRLFEGYMKRDLFYKTVTKIRIEKNIECSGKLIERLKEEFGNIETD